MVLVLQQNRKRKREVSMDNNEKKAFFSGLLIGTLAGAIVSGISALLMAPYSGEATRHLIRARGDAIKSDAERRMTDAVRDFEVSVDRAKKAVANWIEKGNKAVQQVRKPSSIAGRMVEKVLEK
jgi:gas vesicle protein